MDVQYGHWIVFGIVAAIVAGIALAIAVFNSYDRTRVEAWQEFAMQRGLNFHAVDERNPYPRVDGHLDGRAFAMFESTTGGDAHQPDRAVTRIHLEPEGLPRGLILHERSSGTFDESLGRFALGVARKLGREIPDVVATGEPAFDAQWDVRGFDADEVRTWLGSEARRAAALEVAAAESFDIAEGGIGWEGSTPRTREEIEAVVTRLQTYAERMEAR